MNLTPLQDHVLAYYLDHSAKEFSMTGRWFPYSELDFIFADKIRQQLSAAVLRDRPGVSQIFEQVTSAMRGR